MLGQFCLRLQNCPAVGEDVFAYTSKDSFAAGEAIFAHNYKYSLAAGEAIFAHNYKYSLAAGEAIFAHNCKYSLAAGEYPLDSPACVSLSIFARYLPFGSASTTISAHLVGLYTGFH
ncbi:hypothetical protein SAMN05444162_1789 [Paenibacillaceae bacterium GAS479]|nr:hypothetical protein SAMN05444162_1789 [Paenibacillaceae bacterium GAS479]